MTRTISTPRAQRFQIERLHIIYDTGDSFWTAPALDVSETGLFIETHHELPLGTRVSIMVDVPEEEKLPFEIFGEVVRVNEYDPDNHFDRTPGMALRWVNMSIEQIRRVRAFLQEHGVAAKDA